MSGWSFLAGVARNGTLPLAVPPPAGGVHAVQRGREQCQWMQRDQCAAHADRGPQCGSEHQLRGAPNPPPLLSASRRVMWYIPMDTTPIAIMFG